MKSDHNDFSEPRITWGKCVQIWGMIIAGDSKTKHNAVEHLKKFWFKRTHSKPENSEEQIRLKAWYTIAREAILDKFTRESGLQCKLTSDGKDVFCRVRAPIQLLEMEADRVDYKLQFRGEIDPGTEEFWNKQIMQRDEEGNPTLVQVEKQEAEIDLDRDEAEQILERLYTCGKISPNELGVKDDENSTAWTNRVHSLERIADKVPITNKYPCFVKFSTQDSKRYLYNTYPSVRGKTLFRSKDRLFLTKSLLDHFFNLQMLSKPEFGVVKGIMPLHDSNRGEKLTVEVLNRRWVRFWEVSSKEVGAPYVTHEAYDENTDLWWYLRPFSQPLADIREYFGEKIALYFSWLGYYTCALLVPFALGMAMYGIEILRGYVDVEDGEDWFLYGFYMFVVAWSEVFRCSWRRENCAINLRWGTVGFEKTEHDRPEFVPDGMELSYIANEPEATYPDWKRNCFSFVSNIIIVFMVVIDLAFIGAVFLAEYIVIVYFPEWDKWWMIWAASSVHAVALQVAAIFYPGYAILLNDSENYRTDTDYNDYFVGKIIVFQIVNSYFACAFTIFAKKYVFDDCLTSCLDDLRVLLYAIIAVRTVWSIATFVYPWTVSCYNKTFPPPPGKKQLTFCETYCSYCFPTKMEEGVEHVPLVDDPDDDFSFMGEVLMMKYEGSLYGFSDVCLQFGYVSLFSIALPILPAMALAENWVKIRVDAYKLTALCQRPHVQIAEDIGAWDGFMTLMSVLGIMSSTGIVVFAGPNFSTLGFYDKLILFLAAEQIIMLFTYFLPLILPWISIGYCDWMDPEPSWLDDEQGRQDYITGKFYLGQSDDNDAISLDAIKGQVSDNIDVDALNLYDLRKNITISEAEYKEMEKLEAERRKWNRDLKTVKDQLQVVYKSETFNEITGIGETKTGLPLGRINIKVIQIENLKAGENFDFNDNGKIKIRVNIRGLRSGGGDVVPKLGPRGDTAAFALKDGKAVFNTSLGPYAPVKTIEAEIIFYVLDCTANEAIVATSSIKLAELQKQVPVDKTLSLKVMQKDGTIGNTGTSRPRLFCTMTLQYSKVVPLREKIYFAQDNLRRLERELVALKAGTKVKDGDDSGRVP